MSHVVAGRLFVFRARRADVDRLGCKVGLSVWATVGDPRRRVAMTSLSSAAGSSSAELTRNERDCSRNTGEIVQNVDVHELNLWGDTFGKLASDRFPCDGRKAAVSSLGARGLGSLDRGFPLIEAGSLTMAMARKVASQPKSGKCASPRESTCRYGSL